MKIVSQIAAGKKQAGVTMLLAVLIVATLSIISTTVAFLSIQEVRQARATLYTEPAIGAAQTGAEQGIWAIKRSGSVNGCSGGSSTSSSLTSSNSLAVVSNSFGAATFQITAGTPYDLYLYDPCDKNGDYDLLGCGTCPVHSTNTTGFKYANLDVTYVSGSFTVNVVANRLSGTTLGSTSVTPSNTTGHILSMDQGMIAGDDNRIHVQFSVTSGTATITVNTDRGMPNLPTIDATGCSAKTRPGTNCTGNEVYNRRLNVTVPQ